MKKIYYKTMLANLALICILSIVGSILYCAIDHILGIDAKFSSGIFVGLLYMALKFKSL